MKIVFLLTLLPAICICTESHKVDRGPPHQRPPTRTHLLHNPPARPDYAPVNQGHCHGPNNRECFERTIEYAPYLYPEYPYYYYESYRPIARPAQGLPKEVPPPQNPPAHHFKEPNNPDHCHGPNRQDCFKHNVEYPLYQYSAEYQYYEESYKTIARPAQGPPKKLPPARPPPARHLKVTKNEDHCHGPNRQDCFKRDVEYPPYQYSAEYQYYDYESYRPIARPHQGLPKNPPPVKRHKDRRFRVHKNPDHCHGPNSGNCYITTVEYPSQYSAEHPDESYNSPFRRSFCPKRYSWPCYQKVNECCSDEDCHPIQFCCFENCGNTCQFPVSFPSDGFRVPQNDRKCRVAPTFGRG